MQAFIRTLPAKKLIGKKLEMSLNENKTQELWSSFMPLRKELKHAVGSDLYSLQIFSNLYNFKQIDPGATFVKWAAVEVSSFDNLPDGIEKLELEAGLYAVFIHQGTPAQAPKTFGYIFGTWLPNSEYELDARPHFELLGEKYKHNDQSSEEEVWIPIRKK